MDSLENLPQFVANYLRRRSFPRIYGEQKGIAQSRIYSRPAKRIDNNRPRSRSGVLMESLQSAPTTISTGAVGVEASMFYPYYIRFLDMKRLGNHKIYNRPIWGILYRQTFNDIKYDLQDWLRRNMFADFSEIYPNK